MHCSSIKDITMYIEAIGRSCYAGVILHNHKNKACFQTNFVFD